MAAADVGDAVEVLEVEERFQERPFHGGIVGHAELEVFERRGVLGNYVEAMAAEGLLHAIFAGFERVKDVFVGAHVPGIGEEHGHAADRIRGVGTEAVGERREGETLAGVFEEKPDGGEHAEDTIEAGGVGGCGCGECFGGGGLSGRHVVGNAELGDGGDGGGNRLAPEHVHDLGGGWKFGWVHASCQYM